MTPRSDSPAAWLWGVVAFAALFVLWALRDLVVLVSLAFLLAYLLDPLVSAVQRVPLPRNGHAPRAAAAAAVILILTAAAGTLIVIGVPRLAAEFAHFVQGVPANAENLLASARAAAEERGLGIYVDPVLEQAESNTGQMLANLGPTAAGWLGKLFSGLGEIVGVALMPVLAYYLLTERDAVARSLMGFVPEASHARLRILSRSVDQSVRSYVRGQSLVCLIMGSLVGLALALIGYPVAALLGVLVGVAEVLPFIGFWFATSAIALTGYGVSPTTAMLGVSFYVLINNLIGILVTPRIMGRHLRMHPFVVIVSVLAGGKLLGPAGVMLALPGAATLQAVVTSMARTKREGSPPAS